MKRRKTDSSRCTILFEPAGMKGECFKGESVLDCARRLGVGLVNPCGGKGKCHGCKIRVLNGTVAKPVAAERETFSARALEEGWRLACRVRIEGDCTVLLPPATRPVSYKIQIEGTEQDIPADSPVKNFPVRLSPPTLEMPTSDDRRLTAYLEKNHGVTVERIDFETLKGLAERLREWNWAGQAVLDRKELVCFLPQSLRPLGLAVDLGTTSIAGYLVDLESGRTMATGGRMNPQAQYGEDLISRAEASLTLSKRNHLRTLAVRAIDSLASELCAKVGAKPGQIVASTIVGNTVEQHLLLGLTVEYLIRSPFVPSLEQAIEIKNRDLSWSFAPGAYTYFPPGIAGFVGSDHVAMLLACNAPPGRRPVVALDIGTNTEISLLDGSRITTVSCASGPAFEGGHIRNGMRAASGAIEKVSIHDGTVEIQTIDNAPPIGLCGSGILDALAQLYLSGVVDERGRMHKNHPLVREQDSHREFVLTDSSPDRFPLAVTQRDIREIQLAKAAIRAGIFLLLDSQGYKEEDIAEIIIAGAFGSYIDIGSAITIGMLPPLPTKRFRQIGNAAGIGAKHLLISRRKREEAEAIASRAAYMELASQQDFSRIFVQASYLGTFFLVDGMRRETHNGNTNLEP